MARAPAEKVGRGECPTCGETVTFRKSTGGLLSHKCDACDSSGYAQPGGLAYTKAMKSIERETPAPAPTATHKPAAADMPQAPAPATDKPTRKAFSLSDL
jgi:predicted RNA-binding Zn-ribbon protein involved in translation (DUF1610 family)